MTRHKLTIEQRTFLESVKDTWPFTTASWTIYHILAGGHYTPNERIQLNSWTISWKKIQENETTTKGNGIDQA